MPKMRSVLVDWLVGVHLQFKLLPETVYTTVAILDRLVNLIYLSAWINLTFPSNLITNSS